VLVTNPSTTAPAFYPVTLSAANSSAPAKVTSTGETVAVGSTLTVGVATDKASYTLPKSKNGTVYATITTTVTSGGSAVNGAGVTVSVMDPKGKVASFTGTTGSTGTWSTSYAMKTRTSPTGTYSVTSKGTMGSMTGTASAQFTLQ
jgi:hypothetical protein